MIDNFKIWISSLLCLGIFVTFLELVMPSSKLKKYIYSLVGIVAIITIVSPVVNFYKSGGKFNFEKALETMSNNFSSESKIDTNDYSQTSNKLIKDQFVVSIKNDLKEKLESKGVKVKEIEIDIDDVYNINKIGIKTYKLESEEENLNSINEIISYINKEYDIEYSKISVIESGV